MAKPLSEKELASKFKGFQPGDKKARAAVHKAHVGERTYLKYEVSPPALSGTALAFVCNECGLYYPCPTALLINYIADLEQGRIDDFEMIRDELARIEKKENFQDA